MAGMILSIDLETYSDVNLKSCGVYAYTASPNFEIMLLAYAYDDTTVKIIDLRSGEDIPCDLKKALTDPYYTKTAYNANFERTCLTRHFGVPMPPEQWRCTAVHAATLGMPPTLGQVAQVLGFPDDKQKMGIGMSLIRYFCIPCKPTKINGERDRNLPSHDPEKWETFKRYCKRDVEVEIAIRKKLDKFTVPENEQKLWELDQRINDYGVKVDTVLAANAIECDALHCEKLMSRAIELTGLKNPKSVTQLKNWLFKETCDEVESLNKIEMPKLIAKNVGGAVEEVLKLRQELSKTSIKKYQAMLNAVNPNDDRVRGLLQFYGANRTGRWAGRLVQVQNLPKNYMDDLDMARSFVKQGLYDSVDMIFDSTSKVLSQLTRTAFIPETGKRFIVADFSAIEARIIAWLSGEQWRMEVFKTHGKIYEASASQMFRVPMEKISKGNPEYALRQKGKIAELALGYGGSVGALTTMGALDMGLTDEELKPLVDLWRSANPAIVQYWWSIGNTALKVVKTRSHQSIGATQLEVSNGVFFITLPSGRKLAYLKPEIRLNKYGREGLSYEGVDQETKKWGRQDTYGPKLVENIVQAISRDCLAVAMQRIDMAGYQIVMHVHDEVILETPIGSGSLEDVCEIMAQCISWAQGLPLPADGFETLYYRKE